MPMDVAVIALDLGFTIVIYGAGPVVMLLLRRKPISAGKLKLFHVAYTAVVALILAFFNSFAGDRVNFFPALLWGGIFFYINRTRLTNRGLLVNNIEPVRKPVLQGEPKEVVEQYCSEYVLPKAEEPLAAVVPEAAKYKRLCIVLAVVLALVIFLGGATMISERQKAQSAEQRALTAEGKLKTEQATVEKQKDRISKLHDQIDELRKDADDAEFLRRRIGFIVDGSNYYHHRGCPVFQAESTFWAHNIEYCQSLGYSKCPVCWKSAPDSMLTSHQLS